MAKRKEKKIPDSNRYEHIVSMLKKKKIRMKDSKALDCASGDCSKTKILADAGMKVKCADNDKDKVEQCLELGYDAIEADILQLPYKDNEFDLIICSETLEHLTFKESKRAVRELRRVTRKDGVIIVTVPGERVQSMKNPLHKQFISEKKMLGLFNGCERIYYDYFKKGPVAAFQVTEK